MYQKRDLKIGVCYKAIVGNLHFSVLSKQELSLLFSDGRICGRMVEPLLAKIFNDFTCSISGNNKFDLTKISNINLKQEIKTFTRSSGCNLIPSSQIGKGRKYDISEYHTRVKQMESYIIVDIRDFPNIKIIAWGSDHILKNYSDGRPGKKDGKVSDKIFNSPEIIDLGVLE